MREDQNWAIVPISGDPEAMAKMLIQDSLPRKFLDEVDISNDQGVEELLGRLMQRQYQASLEKDEIIRFTKRNERPLKDGVLKQIADTSHFLAFKQFEEEEGGKNPLAFFKFIDYFLTQVQRALAGNPDEIDVKSDRLLWLIHALGLSVSDSYISYAEGLRILNKQEHRERISHSSIVFFIRVFLDNIEAPEQPTTEYLMFVIECALIAGNRGGVATGLLFLGHLNPPKEIDSWLDLLNRANGFLEESGGVPSESKAFIQRAFSRFRREVDEDDF